MVRNYDERCLNLAEVFIDDDRSIDTNRAHFLAAEIQTTIEDWLQRQKQPCDCCGNAMGAGDHSKCIYF